MIISIIGTRPQYIKVKPIQDKCREMGIEHQVWDTGQHYTDTMSEDIIKDLGLTIDRTLSKQCENEMEFIYCLFYDLATALSQVTNLKHVLIYGDTNSAFVSALICHKLKIPFSHVEAGIRCGDMTIPEEVNRCYIDNTATLNFCPTERDAERVHNSTAVGDLEYEYLNNLNPPIKRKKFGLMTIHRQSNCTDEQLQKIFNFIDKIPYTIYWPLHHRVKPIIQNNIKDLPTNLHFLDAQPYSKMVKLMANCKFILTDSGGLIKTAPFFGKKTLIMRDYVGWRDTMACGYTQKCLYKEDDITWLLSDLNKRDPAFYVKDEYASDIILKRIQQCI